MLSLHLAPWRRAPRKLPPRRMLQRLHWKLLRLRLKLPHESWRALSRGTGAMDPIAAFRSVWPMRRLHRWAQLKAVPNRTQAVRTVHAQVLMSWNVAPLWAGMHAAGRIALM